MKISDRLARLVPDLSHTIVRFPMCCLVSVIAFLIVNLDVADLINLITGHEERVYFSLAAAFLGTGAGHLFAEGRKWPQLHGVLLAGVMGLVFGLIYLFHEATSADPLFLFSGTAMLVMTAGHLRRDASENALWLFNARFGLAAVLAFIVALVFCGGLSAILASMDYLFGVSIRGRYYEHIWASGATIIGPIYGLSLMPKSIDDELTFTEPPSIIDRGISVLINYILAPMILVYLVILYTYAGKIALQWSLPKGQIGIMVLVFGLGGTATYLIAGPWAERGTRVLKWFMHSWFWLTLVPVGLLATAVYRRVADYGVTPERYGLVIVGLWLLAMVVYFTVRRRQVASSIILASLGGLLLAGAFGPWGAQGLSISNQIGRLNALLADNGYLSGGRLVETLPAPEKISPDQSTDGASIVDFLRKVDALDRLQPIFAGRKDDPFKDKKNVGSWAIAAAINENLGFRYYGKTRAGGRNFYFNGNLPIWTEFGGELVFHGPIVVNSYTKKPKPDAMGSGEFHAYISEGQLVIGWDGKSWRQDVVALLKLVEAHSRSSGSQFKAFRFDIDGNAGTATLIITSANGELDGTKETMRSLRFWAFLPKHSP